MQALLVGSGTSLPTRASVLNSSKSHPVRPLFLSTRRHELIRTEWFVNVQDTARLHIAALIDADIKSERVFAFSEPYNWNSVLAAMRKARPDSKVPEDLEDNSKDLSKVLPKARAEEILKKNFGQDKFIGLDESIRANIQNL
jgi:hypothetical protein